MQAGRLFPSYRRLTRYIYVTTLHIAPRRSCWSTPVNEQKLFTSTVSTFRFHEQTLEVSGRSHTSYFLTEQTSSSTSFLFLMLLVVYLTTLSVAQIIQRLTIGRLIHNELERKRLVRVRFCCEDFGWASSRSDDEPSGEYALHYKRNFAMRIFVKRGLTVHESS
jgi:hypothetical protein